MGSAPRGPSTVMGRFFRGISRRGRLLSLFPLLLVALAGVVFLRFVPRPSSRAAIAGYEAVLRASPFEGALLVSVTFLPAGRTLPAGAAEATVAFVLTDTGERLIVSEALDRGPSTIRGKMRYTGKEKKLTAQVRIADREAGLSLGLKRP